MKSGNKWIQLFAVSLTMPSVAICATLTMVPMQGSMIMPKFAYHAADGSLTVSVSSKIPQLIPLAVSNPADNFDPVAPWFSDLDPSEKGLSFSRRYGFTMDTASEDLPDGVTVYIRKLSSSPGLDCYDPVTWEPLFGTAGSTNLLHWDTTMYHPAFTAVPGTNTFTAQFEGFLINTNSGLVLPGGNSGPITLHWTNSPDGRPLLAIGRTAGFTLQWPAGITNYVLEAQESPSEADWAQVSSAPVRVDANWQVPIDATNQARVFRLRRFP